MVGRRFFAVALRTLHGDPLMALGAVLLIMFLLAGALGPLLPIGDPTAIGVGPRLSPPSQALPLGTDELGRSNLPRVVGGILVTFYLAGFAVLLTAVVGVFIGLLAAYFGGYVDGLVARLTDVMYAFPAIILGLA